MNTVRFYLNKLSAWQPLHWSLNFIWILMLALCWLYNAEFSHSHYRLNHHTNFLPYCCDLTFQNSPLQEITCISTLATSKVWQIFCCNGIWNLDFECFHLQMISYHKLFHRSFKVVCPFCKDTKRITEGCEIAINIGFQKLSQLEKEIQFIYTFSIGWG